MQTTCSKGVRLSSLSLPHLTKKKKKKVAGRGPHSFTTGHPQLGTKEIFVRASRKGSTSWVTLYHPVDLHLRFLYFLLGSKLGDIPRSRCPLRLSSSVCRHRSVKAMTGRTTTVFGASSAGRSEIRRHSSEVDPSWVHRKQPSTSN